MAGVLGQAAAAAWREGQPRCSGLSMAGDVGRPLLAVCSTAWFRDQSCFDEPWRGRWDTEGGGPTIGHGIHQMDLMCHLLGDWSQVSAVARRQARHTQTEDLPLAHVTFTSGAVASGHRAQFAHVLRALRDGLAPPVALDEALRSMELVAAIYHRRSVTGRSGMLT